MTNLQENSTVKRGNNFKHGLCHTRIYHIWGTMLSRCVNPNNKKYKRYGGRGITVCERWMTFSNFYEDMNPTYADNLTIDRINNDGNYEPGNCRWATCKEQNRNRCSSRLITYNGETKTLIEWSEIVGLCIGTILRRLNNGWSPERTFNTVPVVGRNQFSNHIKH